MNYGVVSMIDQEPAAGQISWSADYDDGPWEWFSHTTSPLPGWDVNASADVEMQFTSQLDIDDDLMATGSFVFTTTVAARTEGEVTGTLIMSEVADEGLVDLNASHAITDHETGMILLRSGSPLDEGRAISEITVLDATGIFAGIEQVGVVGWVLLGLLHQADLGGNRPAAEYSRSAVHRRFLSERCHRTVPPQTCSGKRRELASRL